MTEEYINLFFEIPFADFLAKTVFTYNTVIISVRNYCIQKGINYENLINEKIIEFSKTLYEENKTTNLMDLSNKYKTKSSRIKELIEFYCTQNNLEPAIFRRR